MSHLDPANIDAATMQMVEQSLTCSCPCQVLAYHHLASTNATAKEMAQSLPDTALIIAAEQSAGRGRLGRSFFSPGATGLYMSLFLRRDLPAALAPRLTTLAAVATAEAIEVEIGRSVGIKWVNDLYLDERKVCGILTEGAIYPGTTQLQYAIIGIGINLTPPESGFPPELAGIAGAILPKYDNIADLRIRLAAKIVDSFLPLIETALPGGAEEEHCFNAYCSRSILQNHVVTVHQGGAVPRLATVLGIDQEYRLLVRYEDGSEGALESGEVSVRVKGVSHDLAEKLYQE